MNSSRGTAHFVWRCSECSRDSSAKFEPVIKSYSAESNGQLAPLLVMDCRGLEFIGFEPRVVTYNSFVPSLSHLATGQLDVQRTGVWYRLLRSRLIRGLDRV